MVRFFGQKIVTMFLFYSGIGVNESIRNKGINYTKTLFNKSIILLVKFQISLLLYLLENIFILKNKITLKSYLLSALFRSSLGNGNWLTFTIISFYFCSYLSFRLSIKKYISILFINVICFIHSI